ncbi:nuclear transport factor 2 family protein [Alicyclobacillus cycloheptanicus]|uniref:DUF4878 domain-containing protein n=1 Tax=Alicyclobacillus cycloheptanicus TaxID=1457 RepID=A0ABT9XNK3_9BACL|nr:DUF4878 domain-containing protein [Alicyclobacillus cycloheptanicus]MDQ0191629.1 hypothetical protein [Alicyclobacillus cycloheptanicus]
MKNPISTRPGKLAVCSLVVLLCIVAGVIVYQHNMKVPSTTLTATQTLRDFLDGIESRNVNKTIPYVYDARFPTTSQLNTFYTKQFEIPAANLSSYKIVGTQTESQNEVLVTVELKFENNNTVLQTFRVKKLNGSWKVYIPLDGENN